MKSFILELEFLIFVAIYFNFEYSTCRKFPKCDNGYIGINCEISTCLGYELCGNETICVIKSNNHLCVCQFFDKNRVYREIENCIRKYTIPNGICFSIKNGQELCECKLGWVGSNCENRVRTYPYPSEKLNIYKNNLHHHKKLKYKCSFTDKYNNNVTENCYNEYKIKNGICYLIRDRYFPTCSCLKGWEGGDTDCETATCNKYDICLNGGICFIENNRHICSCANGYYGDNCEKKCDIDCGAGTIVINLTRACECLCPYPYLPPNCMLPTDKTVVIFTEITSPETTLESTTESETSKTTNFTLSTSIPTDSLTTIQTTISNASSTFIYTSVNTPTSTTSTETNFTHISTTHKTNITEYTEAITNMTTLISIASTTTQNNSNNNSFSKSQTKLEFISIPFVIAFALLVIGLIYHYRKFFNKNIRLKVDKFNNSNSEL